MTTIKIPGPNLDRFYDQNPNFDILKFDFLNPSELSQLETKLKNAGVDQTDIEEKVNKLKAYQRLLRIEPEPSTAKIFLDDTLDSVQKITALSQTQFIKKYSSKLGENGTAKAKQIYLAAANIKSQTMHLYANVASLAGSRYFKALAVNHIPKSIPTYFESLSSYQQIFGSLNYCQCEECKSIFSPAAYLVDLLRIIDKAITVPNTTRKKSADNIPDGLKLFDRRPDLANIQLTCANTNDVVPYLQIVNKILEQTVANALKKENKLLNDNDDDVWLTLANTYYPFNLPFNLPLHQLRTYLGTQKISLSEIYEALDPSATLSFETTREYLHLSVEQLNNLKQTTDETQLSAEVSKNYGLDLTQSDLQGLNKLETFMAQTGLSRQDVKNLFFQNLNSQEIFDVSGDYTPTAFGTTLTLKQVGDRVTGTYDFKKIDNNGELEGTLKRDEQTGQWSVRGQWIDGTKQLPKSTGHFEFNFVLDGSGFTGQSQISGKVGEYQAWNGTRNSATPPTSGTIPHHFFINNVLGDQQYLSISINTDDPNHEYEQIENLSLATLDTINRFHRLAKALGWSYSDLDWVLTSVGATEIEEKNIIELAKIKKLIDEYDLPLELLTSLWFDIKTIGIGKGEQSEAAFDQIFNNSVLLKATDGKAYHPKILRSTTSYVNPLYQDDLLNWVVSVDQVEKLTPKDRPSETELQRANMIVASIPAASDEITTVAIAAFGTIATIELSVPNLSVLYRHTILPKQLGMGVPDYLVLLHLLELTEKVTIAGKEVTRIKHILDRDDVLKISESVRWLRDSGLTVYDINYICNQTPSVYVAGYDPKNTPAFLSALEPIVKTALLSKDTFTYQNITQEASNAYYTILLNNSFIDDTGLVLKDLKDVSELPDLFTVSSSNEKLKPTEEQKKYILAKLIKQRYEQSERFAEQLSAFFGIKADVMTVLINGTQLWLNDSNIWKDFIHAAIAKDTNIPAQVTQFLGTISQYLTLQKGFNLSIKEIANIFQYPQVYGITPPAPTATPPQSVQLTLTNVRNIYELKKLVAAFGDQKNDLVNYFAEVWADNPLKPLAIEQGMTKLSTLTGWNQGQCSYLCQKFFGAGNICKTVTGVWQLKQVFDISEALGVEVYFLEQLSGLQAATADTWTDYTNLASKLLQSIKGQTTNEAWPTTYKQLSKFLEQEKRNALLKLAIWALGKQYTDITNPRRLYEYLLIDVEMSGCAEISYVKEALNTAQLYLQRCRLNLERNVTISTDDIPTIWWEWLMNYRIWEANRQIFLYPENYIDPTLRKSKTSLFQDFENTLLQGEVTKEKVEEAYKTYLEKFTQLAKLKYVDAYHATVHSKEKGAIDTLFLFARTQEEPYNFYYIAREKAANCDNLDAYTWTEWKPIDITIHAKTITPVYAFHRLFVFWVEIKKVRDKDPNSKDPNSKESDAERVIGLYKDVYKATIKYSFYNFSGKWLQPQTLKEDIITYIVGDSYLNTVQSNNNKLLDVFDLDSLYWNKVYLLRTPSGNYQPDTTSATGQEKVSLFYGPFLDKTSPAVKINLNGASPTLVKGDLSQFETTLDRSLQKYNQLSNYRAQGFQPLHSNIILNADLQHDYLSKPAEILLVGQTAAKDAPFTFKIAVNTVEKKLQLVNSTTVIHDNYMGDIPPKLVQSKSPSSLSKTSFENTEQGIDSTLSGQIFDALQTYGIIDPTNGNKVAEFFNSFLDIKTFLPNLIRQGKLNDAQVSYIQTVLFNNMGSVVLFANIANKNSQAITVKNQPGWVIYDNGNETFLLTPKTPQFKRISDGLSVDYPVIRPDSFVTNDISDETSPLIYDACTTYGIVNTNTGLVDLETLAEFPDLEILFPNLLAQNKLTDQNLIEIGNILRNNPILPDNFFDQVVTDANTVQQIRDSLTTYGVLDANHRVDLTIVEAIGLTVMLPNLLANKKLTEEQVIELRNKLLDLPVPISLDYWNEESNSTIHDLHDYTFTLTRLTTGAVQHMSTSLFSGGIDALLSLSSQQPLQEPQHLISRLAPSEYDLYLPSVAKGDPVDFVLDGSQVEFTGPYGNYYWELFFHGPLLVATLLNKNQQFRDAQKWLQYIFDPTISPQPVTANSFTTDDIPELMAESIFNALKKVNLIDQQNRVARDALTTTATQLIDKLSPENVHLSPYQSQEVLNTLVNQYLVTPTGRYWQFLPFRNHTLESLQAQLQNCAEIAAYNDNPFGPHAIARLRIGAYEKAVVMKYIDNLLDWGDYEFSQYSWESITAARMLYVYAYDLLGTKPVDLGPCDTQFPATFADILARYQGKGDIPQFLIDLEHVVANGKGTGSVPNPPSGKPFNDLDVYFCVPENEKFTSYWDRVQDRLYKIRHCLNIKGQKQPLPLFQPPISPMELVRAAASDNNILDVVSQLQPNIPYYRFSYMLEQAKNATSTLIQFGQSLLAALEKNDAEGLALLHSTQSGTILNMTTLVKHKQIEDLQNQLAALQQNQHSAQHRHDYYKTLISNGLNAAEVTNLVLSAAVLPLYLRTLGLQGISIGGYLLPVIFGFSDGDMKVGDAMNMATQISSTIIAILQQSASIAAIVGGHQRRQEDWEFQQQLAQYEIDQINQQIEANKVRIVISQQELAIHQKQIEQSDQEKDFLKSKFTNQQLYLWMIDRLSTIYFQTYRIALEMALAAQAAYQYELDRDDTFITFSYWDSLHKGLLAGEGLMLSLNQLEKAYIDNNVRRLEIEKTISVRQHFPEAFFGFKWGAMKGQLNFTLSESLFDFDFPSHYCRKIKSISISIPAVIGPYQNINATLIQNSNTVVLKPDPKAVDYLIYQTTPRNSKQQPEQPLPDTLRQNWVPNQEIALSKGVDDTGIFVLDFRDERYLPFEGTGAVSSWTLSLPPETNLINFDSISDIIIKVQYTAKDGGMGTFGEQVKGLYRKQGDQYQNLKAKSFELKQAFAGAWHQMFATAPTDGKQKIVFPVTDNIILPNLEGVTLYAVLLQLEVADGKTVSSKEGNEFVSLQVDGQPTSPVRIGITNNYGELESDQLSDLQDSFNKMVQKTVQSTQWSLVFDLSKTPEDLTTGGQLDETKLLDIVLVIVYSATPFS